MDARRCLVTGGAGFVGSWWVRHLLAAGHRVTVLDSFITGQRMNLPREVRLVEGDVTDTVLVDRWIRRADTVFHLASLGSQYTAHDPLTGLTGNVLGSLSTVAACAYHNKELVLVSSAGVYGKVAGSSVREHDESRLPNPVTGPWLYSLAKLFDESLVQAWRAEVDLRVKIVRLFPCIGPRQARAYGRIVPRLVLAALQGKPLKIPGDGSDRLSFIFIKDAVTGIDLVWRHGAIGEPYNLGGTEEITTRRLAERILQLTGSNSPIRLLKTEQPAPHPPAPDMSRLASLGFRPRYSLDDALRAIIAYYRGAR